MADVEDEPKTARATAVGAASKVFVNVEYAVYAALGGLLALIAVFTLIHGGINVVEAILKWDQGEELFGVLDDLLFVLMLVEILHTVRVSIESGTLDGEPFLVVGLIASIRRVLVITLESSGTTKPGEWTPQAAGLFRANMLELGVLCVLIAVMVVSIYLMRKSTRQDRKKALLS